MSTHTTTTTPRAPARWHLGQRGILAGQSHRAVLSDADDGTFVHWVGEGIAAQVVLEHNTLLELLAMCERRAPWTQIAATIYAALGLPTMDEAPL